MDRAFGFTLDVSELRFAQILFAHPSNVQRVGVVQALLANLSHQLLEILFGLFDSARRTCELIRVQYSIMIIAQLESILILSNVRICIECAYISRDNNFRQREDSIEVLVPAAHL